MCFDKLVINLRQMLIAFKRKRERIGKKDIAPD